MIQLLRYEADALPDLVEVLALLILLGIGRGREGVTNADDVEKGVIIDLLFRRESILEVDYRAVVEDPQLPDVLLFDHESQMLLK